MILGMFIEKQCSLKLTLGNPSGYQNQDIVLVKNLSFFFLEKSKKQQKEACSCSVEKYHTAIYENLFA